MSDTITDQALTAFPEGNHDHRACIDKALDRAEAICAERKVRLTPVRARVLELVWASHAPVGAYGLLDELKNDKAGAAAPTIYRALEFLLEQGLIHRIESLNAYVGCDHPDSGHSGPILICRACGQAAEIEDNGIGAVMARWAGHAGFEVETPVIELKGLCPRCGDGVSGGESSVPASVPAPHSGPTLIEAVNLRVVLSGLDIISNVSLSVHKGEIVTIIGPNGAGKTTLVRALLGLLPIKEGRVFHPLSDPVIGYVPQKIDIDETLPLTVKRFLDLAGPQASKRREKVLAEVGAAHLEARPLQRLSGGELRRVLLARALLRQPDLLVLDEPVQGVDVIGQAELYQLISRLRDNYGCGILMVSHDLHVVMAATDRVVCLNHHVCCQGLPETVSKHPEYLSLFGPEEARGMAVYTHHHDHRHDDGHDEGHDHEDHDHG